MKQIRIADTTLCRENNNFSFKEKLEIARQLENLGVDVIELPQIENSQTDILLARTISSFLKNSTLSIAAGNDEKSIDLAAEALANTKNSAIRIELPVSPVGMEYACHKKAVKMLEWIETAVSKAKSLVSSVEFCMLDATRAEEDFIETAINVAVKAGADTITICDTASFMLPDDFASFTQDICNKSSVPVSVNCMNNNGLAEAGAVLAVRNGATAVKTSVGGQTASLENFAEIVKDCGDKYSLKTSINYTQLNRTIKQINRITEGDNNKKSVVNVESDISDIRLDKNDTQQAVISEVKKLGYDLSDDDCAKVYEEFLRVAAKKTVGAQELDAIVASAALQVPSTYKLKKYVINNGNIITASANIMLERDGEELEGIEIGDGPIDASFIAIEKIIGRHFELDDFQIQAVTEGAEAMGSALVKLRSNGKVYSGKGISTDIIGASIRAYLNAINKIVYEEA